MSNNPTKIKSWHALDMLSQKAKNRSIKSLFEEDPQRFGKFSTSVDGIFFDYSKQNMTAETLGFLIDLATSQKLAAKRQAMFDGEKINKSENRAALHTALRRPETDKVFVDGHNIIPDIYDVLKKMEDFSNQIRQGTYKGATGKQIRHIISIGIGGSDTGPRVVCQALGEGNSNIDVNFVSNTDADDLLEALKKSDPETTLFVVISKSFKTQDTLINALTAKEWLTSALPTKSNIGRHFVAISANEEAVKDFGISKENFYPIGDWVNGRFSVWSAVGLPICLKYGFDAFRQFLDGARLIDCHFIEENFENNIPVLMGLIGIWNRNFLDIKTQAILPYSQRLKGLPVYLRQQDMESNGKTVNLDGELIDTYQTGPVIFGEAGTNGQHSFYQFLHQGSDVVTCDFIGVIEPNHKEQKHHNLLLSNMLAQGQALMEGRQEMKDFNRYFSGSKPCSTLLLDKIDAFHLGMLIALYEHKIFVQGVIWNINSFDQFGVELGKELSNKIENNDMQSADSSTKGLFSLIHKAKK